MTRPEARTSPSVGLVSGGAYRSLRVRGSKRQLCVQDFQRTSAHAAPRRKLRAAGTTRPKMEAHGSRAAGARPGTHGRVVVVARLRIRKRRRRGRRRRPPFSTVLAGDVLFGRRNAHVGGLILALSAEHTPVGVFRGEIVRGRPAAPPRKFRAGLRARSDLAGEPRTAGRPARRVEGRAIQGSRVHRGRRRRGLR